VKRAQTTQQAILEPLEDRVLLAGNVMAEIVGTTLVIEGDHSDNAILIDQTTQGDFRITGHDNHGLTLVNGESRILIGNLANIKNVHISMHFGNDRVGIGNMSGFTTQIHEDLLVNMGAGYNEFYLGRCADATRIAYAGPVSIGGDVDITHDDNGSGSVVLAALACDGDVRVDLGHDFAEKWFVLEDNIPSYLPHLFGVPPDAPYAGSRVEGTVSVVNHAGETNVRLGQSQVEGRLTIQTSDSDDVIDVLSMRFERGLVLRTGGGIDRVSVGDPSGYGVPRDPTWVYALTIETGDGDDEVFLSNLQVWNTTHVDLGPADHLQQLYFADTGYFSTNDLDVFAGGAARVQIGRSRGPTPPALVTGELEFDLSDDGDMLDIRGLKVLGDAAFATGGAHDVVNIAACDFRVNLAADLGDGDDVMYVGNVVVTQGGGGAGGPVLVGTDLYIYAAGGTDRVSLQGVEVAHDTNVQLGTGGGTEMVWFGSSRGRFVTEDLLVGGLGRNVVMIGNGARSAWITGHLTIEMGASIWNDSILIRGAEIGGSVTIFSGDGSDLVYLQNVRISGNTHINTGGGRDAVMALRTNFGGWTAVATGTGNDGMYFRGCTFDGWATFDGGDGDDDFINHALETSNTFNSDLVVVNIPRRRY